MKRLSFSCLLKMLKCQSILFQTTITNQNQWDEMLLTKGVVVIDVYQAWCGPCKAVVNLFRKLKNEFSEDDVLHFAVAEANSIETLQPYRNRCEPVFLFCVNGKIIEMVRGANAPLISKKITELVQEEREIVAGQKERPEVYSQKIYLNIEEYFYYTSMVSLNAHDSVFFTYSVGIIKPDDVLEGQSTFSSSQLLSQHQNVYRDLNMIKFCLIRLEETPETKSILNMCDVQSSIEDASRQLAFFFPNFGQNKTEQKFEKTLALVRPCLLRERRDSIIQRIKDDGFEIAMQKEINLSEEQAREFYKEHENEDYFPFLLEEMTSGPTLVLALTRENAVAHWRNLLGPKTVEEAKKENPNSLRAQYALDNVPINQLHGSSSPNDAQKELEFFFPQEHTLALIKPDAAKKHKGNITLNITLHSTSEVTANSASQNMVMVLTKENAVQEWRQLMGPTDPEVAKESSPESIRALFAQDILSNAVHGSSTREHALESIECIFGEIDID
uniref:NME/NM23 family member 8 n=1 Tax=Anas platyrhynchos TaxID=8839 RepID=A0A8B9TQ91_ANAPL